jgi:hypothetical protein
MSSNEIPTLRHPVNKNGTPIDASFSLEQSKDGPAIFYASRGGTKGTPNARNSQYHIGLAVLLGRLKRLDAVIEAVLLDSIAARQRPVSDRALEFPEDISFAVRLAGIADVDAFRRKISDAQKNVLTAPGRDAKHGNRMRSIRILVSLPAPHDAMSLDAIEQVLVFGDLALPTADPGVLEQRVTRLRSRGQCRGRKVIGCRSRESQAPRRVISGPQPSLPTSYSALAASASSAVERHSQRTPVRYFLRFIM